MGLAYFTEINHPNVGSCIGKNVSPPRKHNKIPRPRKSTTGMCTVNMSVPWIVIRDEESPNRAAGTQPRRQWPNPPPAEAENPSKIHRRITGTCRHGCVDGYFACSFLCLFVCLFAFLADFWLFAWLFVFGLFHCYQGVKP